MRPSRAAPCAGANTTDPLRLPSTRPGYRFQSEASAGWSLATGLGSPEGIVWKHPAVRGLTPGLGLG